MFGVHKCFVLGIFCRLNGYIVYISMYGCVAAAFWLLMAYWLLMA